MRQEFYGMRRANGDWFALEVNGESRVAIFRSLSGAWRAHAKNPELMLFRPVLLDEGALKDLAVAANGRPASFWLVDEEDPAAILTHGHALEFEQLTILEGASLPRPRKFGRSYRRNGLGWATSIT